MWALEQPAHTGHREGCQLQPPWDHPLPRVTAQIYLPWDIPGGKGLRKQWACSRAPPHQSKGTISALAQGCQDTWQGGSRGRTPLSWDQPCSPQRGHVARR